MVWTLGLTSFWRWRVLDEFCAVLLAETLGGLGRVGVGGLDWARQHDMTMTHAFLALLQGVRQTRPPVAVVPEEAVRPEATPSADGGAGGGGRAGEGERTTDDGGSACFSAVAAVTLRSGRSVVMRALRVGVAVATGGGRHSEVCAFFRADRQSNGQHPFARLTTAAGTVLTASP
eukprot:TRINITY_DN2690_c0_g1_i2.p2 TRINITY_DN2690_c0_g1~~TRINITY_DN2690_c0_g1_i2.p2  ORF type:complete len:175 (+),score=49.73 TRINITY_DN2690_c0_g1_i2:468-992(+)